MFEPTNYGQVIVKGGPRTLVLMVNVTNHAHILVDGGDVAIAGGINTGSASFNTCGNITLTGLRNMGEAVFMGSSSITLSHMSNRGHVKGSNVQVGFFNSENLGAMDFYDSDLVFYGGSNFGSFHGERVRVQATLEANHGKLSVEFGFVNITLKCNYGGIYLKDNQVEISRF
jgi:hypothetical protein